MARANSSRERILATAEAIILQKGFAGTSIEDILQRAAITKGGFFYHFNGKGELARALVERYLEEDRRTFAALLARSEQLSEDPLQQLLIFLNLVAEMVCGKSEVHPGCLVAAFTYEIQQFDPEIRGLMEDGLLEWREMIAVRLRRVFAKYPPRVEADEGALADMFSSVLEGGIILARVFGDNQALFRQIQAYRTHLRLLFGEI